MEQISTNNWAYMHFAPHLLEGGITCAQMLVVYTLRNPASHRRAWGCTQCISWPLLQ